MRIDETQIWDERDAYIESISHIWKDEPLDGDDCQAIADDILLKLKQINGVVGKELTEFKTIENGKDTGTFEAGNYEHALEKVLGWHGIVVEEVRE